VPYIYPRVEKREGEERGTFALALVQLHSHMLLACKKSERKKGKRWLVGVARMSAPQIDCGCRENGG